MQHGVVAETKSSATRKKVKLFSVGGGHHRPLKSKKGLPSLLKNKN